MGLDDVFFGYLVFGRDFFVVNIEYVVGVFINMFVCCVYIFFDVEIVEVLDIIKGDFVDVMVYQSCFFVEMQYEL